MGEDPQTKRPSARIFVGIGLASLAYIAVALACLRQWGTPEPWQRIDFFSGSYLALSLLWVAESIYFGRAVGRSKEVMREASGMSYDPGMMKGVILLPLAELSVFLDYGHWHLAPRLEQRALQSLGLLLYLLAAALVLWADTYLARHFARMPAARALISEGPFRWIRHPRYAGLLTSRVAFALVFASPLAWIFALPWLLLMLRRIRREEKHLVGLFGAGYEAYARSTPRLLPGIY